MLLVFGPRSTAYDFGSGHPLTPRRFGPGIDLLRAVGAEPGLAPEPAPDDELLWCHGRRYIEAVKRFSADPYGFPKAGIGEAGDCPPFAGMHETSAAIAGGSIRAMEAILRGDVEHAFHPGGGLHHAMRDRASGFCIYNDPALAIARARWDGLRVMYIDLDVHHGDGVQALHWDDPGVLTFSIHENGRTLFPGTGEVTEIGEGVAAGTSVNVPLPAGTGEQVWLEALTSLVPVLAASFGPDLIVSQHGADSHAWDPLAHLNLTTHAHGEAARLVHTISHACAGGRWLATGGGGYDAYRVVPRTWALTWLAGAHREMPPQTPVAWRERWAADAARFGQGPLPTSFADDLELGRSVDPSTDIRTRKIVAEVHARLVPRLLRAARDHGWWRPPASVQAVEAVQSEVAAATLPPDTALPGIVTRVDGATWDRLALAPRVVAPFDPTVAHALLAAALRDGATLAAAVAGDVVVGLAVRHDTRLLAVGVAPAWRRRGLATALIRLIATGIRLRIDLDVGERDVVDPLDLSIRRAIARRLVDIASHAPPNRTGGRNTA